MCVVCGPPLVGGRFTLVSYEIRRNKLQEPCRLSAGVLRLSYLNLAMAATAGAVEKDEAGTWWQVANLNFPPASGRAQQTFRFFPA